MDARVKPGHDENPGIQHMAIRFDGRVAIVTGAGNGLGRAHALGLASRGAKVVVNDFGGSRDGTGGSLTPAETVVEEIRKAGGTAMADGADVSNFTQVRAMVERATKEWGSVDLLCANAGILRDKSFSKMDVADFAKVLDVHLVGTFYCCKAVWDGMRERNYGRIVLTTSSSARCGRSCARAYRPTPPCSSRTCRPDARRAPLRSPRRPSWRTTCRAKCRHWRRAGRRCPTPSLPAPPSPELA